MAELIPVQVCGTELEAGMVDGIVHVGIRRLCDALEIDHSSQLAKLREMPAATVVIIPMVAADGKTREIACIDLRSVPIWLASINPGKVGDHVREKLIRFQREAADVLADHFLGPRGGTPRVNARELLGTELLDAMKRNDAAEASKLHAALGMLIGSPPKPLPRPAPTPPVQQRYGWSNEAIAELVQAWTEACLHSYPGGMTSKDALHVATREVWPAAERLRLAFVPFTGLFIRSKAIGYVLRSLPEHFDGPLVHSGLRRWRVRLPV